MKRFAIAIALLSCLFTLKGQRNTCVSLDGKINEYIETKKTDSLMLYAKRLENLSKEQASSYYLIKSKYFIGKAFFLQNKPRQSLEILFEGLKLCTSATSPHLKSEIQFLIGVINMNNKNYKTATSYFLQAYEKFSQIKDSCGITRSLLDLIQCYDRRSEFDSSDYYVAYAFKIHKYMSDSEKGHFFGTLGIKYLSGYLIKKNPPLLDSALKYLKKALAVSNNIPSYPLPDIMAMYLNTGSVYYLKKKYDDVIKYYGMAQKIAEQSNDHENRLNIYINSAIIYDELKDYKNCSEFLWKYIDWTDTVQLQKTRELASELDSKYKMELEVFKNDIIKNQGKIIEEKTSEIKNQNAKIYLSWALFILIIGIFVVWLIYFRLKNNSRILIDEAKKRFFTNVVHEVRTPLSMIHAPIQLLKTKATSQEDKQNIELAERNINRLNELITQMLDISKLDQEKYTLKETIGDLELFFHDVINLYTKIAMEKNIAVIPELNFIHKHAIFDKDALQKITGNLLDNAIKFTDSNNQVGISVSSEELENGTNLFIKVWDTGPGMNAYDKEQIFERFHRGQSTEHIKGMGVGLALVKELVDLMHGEISVSSDEGKGSCFEVILTLKSYTETTSEKVNSGNDDKPQVLLIEDDLEILNFNTRYLESNNLHVLKAENGKAAFKIIELNIPDIIVTDLMMQELDGIAFLKKMKSNPATEHIPVIILSAKTSSETRIEALQSGAQSFITKPYLPEELLSTVQSQLDIIKLRKVEFINQIQKPEESVEQKFRNSDPYLQKLFNFVFINLADEEFSVEKLADLMATNRSHFQRKVKALCGLSPSEIIRTVRLEKAREMILTKKSNINEVAYQTGFSSHSYFTKCFTQHFGISPTKLLQTA